MAYIHEIITKKGETKYRAQIRKKGFKFRSAVFNQIDDAKRWSQMIETEMQQDKYFKTEAQRHTLNELIERYMRYILPQKPKSVEKQTQQLNWWKEQIGGKALVDITPALISEQKDMLLSEYQSRSSKWEKNNAKLLSPATVNRYLAALSHVFTIAIKEWQLVEVNPVSRVIKPKEPRGRVRFLSDDERNRLLQVLMQKRSKQKLYIIVVLCLSTGARKMEILGLRWKDIDLERGGIILHETKNNERRVLPLTGYALTLVEEYAANNCKSLDDLVFPSKHNPQEPANIYLPFQTALKRAGITDFRFHDLRHSAASYLAMSGASPSEIAEVLGHKSLEMVKRYAHLSEAHTAKVVARMNERIFSG